jgi:hypothetical protein
VPLTEYVAPPTLGVIVGLCDDPLYGKLGVIEKVTGSGLIVRVPDADPA